MKYATILILISAATFSSAYDFQKEWNAFKKLHQKSYTRLEELKRFNIFKNNVKKIEEHNLSGASYRMEINQFADLSPEEFLQSVTNHKLGNRKSSRKFESKIGEIPDEIDWRSKGAVTEVKNQGSGSAWAYSVTGVLEGQNFVKTGNLVALSDQELADCASDPGCTGGTIEEGYEYVIDHGLSSADTYPIDPNDGTCHRGSIPSAVTETSYILLDTNEEVLKEAVATIGPIAVLVDATTWQLYSSGILSCNGEPTLNHGVLLVGYTKDYWIVKNSWGKNWGENGYIRVARDGNSCGITLHATYPVV